MTFAVANVKGIIHGIKVLLVMAHPLRLIVNPTSGGGRAGKLLPAVLSGLSDRYNVEVCITRSLEHARELVTEAAIAGTPVGAMGGDGFVSSAGTAIVEAGTDTALAVIPAGRGNDFARALGVSNIKQSLSVLNGGRQKTIDVGAINGQLFLAVVSVGFDSVVLAHAQKAKRLPGTLSYPYAVLRALVTWKSVTFDVQLDDDTYNFNGYSVIVANGGYYGGAMNVAPHAELDDGWLDVVMIKDVSKFEFIREAVKVFQGRHVNSKAVVMKRAKRITIASPHEFAFQVDGELTNSLPAIIELKASKLRVFVP